jgi:hypothetical protein
MAAKILLVLGLAAGALALAGGSANAAPGKPAPVPPPPGGFDVNNPPDDVKKLILAAATSGNPVLMRATADQIEKLGYGPQATALRAAADAVDAAQKSLPPAGTVSPAQPVTVPIPGGGSVQLPPVTSLPTSPPAVVLQPSAPSSAPSGANPVAAALTAALQLADPIANGITASPKAKVVVFQTQERTRGTYTGALDGLYGPGVASAVAAYNIVPYPPFIWSADKKKTATNKAKFKALMLKKAAADPTRADEWARVAELAQNT